MAEINESTEKSLFPDNPSQDGSAANSVDSASNTEGEKISTEGDNNPFSTFTQSSADMATPEEKKAQETESAIEIKNEEKAALSDINNEEQTILSDVKNEEQTAPAKIANEETSETNEEMSVAPSTGETDSLDEPLKRQEDEKAPDFGKASSIDESVEKTAKKATSSDSTDTETAEKATTADGSANEIAEKATTADGSANEIAENAGQPKAEPEQDDNEDGVIDEERRKGDEEQALESALSGFSEVLDAYGREILEPTFENVLIMSKNPLKLKYSRIKNAVLSYREMFSRYENDEEYFYRGKKALLKIQLNGDQLLLYLALKSEALDRKVYPHKTPKAEAESTTPVMVTINKGNSLDRGLELINLVMDTNGLGKRKSFENKTYAEDHPINPNAVLRGKEDVPPVEGQYSGEEYEDIFGELTKKVMAENIIEKKKRGRKKKPTGEQILNKQRQTAKTIKAAIALTEPIVYFYDAGVERDNTIAYVWMQQVLNDKFLGKLVPQMYFAVAEGSERIEELNVLALNELTADCNTNPTMKFCLNISCRMLIRQTSLKKLLAAIKTENNNLIVALDCVLLESLGDIGERGVKALQDAGVSIMADNTESAGMKILTEYGFDYFRFDARYYANETPAKNAHLDMVTGFAKVQGIKTSVLNVNTQKDAVYFLTHGVDVIQGEAVCPPKRLVSLACKQFKKLPPVAK